MKTGNSALSRLNVQKAANILKACSLRKWTGM